MVQAALCLAVATVLKMVADIFSLHLTTWLSLCYQRRSFPRPETVPADGELQAREVGLLYREILLLTEQARIEMARPSDPQPIDPKELVDGDFSTVQPQILQEAAQKLEESFQLELQVSGQDQRTLRSLLAQLQSKTSIVFTLTETDKTGAKAVDEDRLWYAQLYSQLFSLWILISQELVCPGITDALGGGLGGFDRNDVFLMTDPVARARYEREGKTEELENDIRYEVMRGKPWHPEDIEFLQQMRILRSQGVIRKMASFWNISPHPSVYRALKDGKMRIGGKQYSFRRGLDMVWACPMLRDLAALPGPVLIDTFSSKRIAQLCGAMSNAMVGRAVRQARSATLQRTNGGGQL